jgi:hypothetical protein
MSDSGVKQLAKGWLQCSVTVDLMSPLETEAWEPLLKVWAVEAHITRRLVCSLTGGGS